MSALQLNSDQIFQFTSFEDESDRSTIKKLERDMTKHAKLIALCERGVEWAEQAYRAVPHHNERRFAHLQQTQAQLEDVRRSYRIKQRAFDANVAEHERILRETQQLEEQQEMSRTVMVRLLSGDVRAVEIDMTRHVSSFADEFAQQNGYNPTSTIRMMFLIQNDESEEDEKENIVFWSHEQRNEEKTIAEMLLTGGNDEPHMLNLLIRPMEDPDDVRASKIELIRKLLSQESLNDNYEDEHLFAMYGTWHLTYLPSTKGNRYLTMKAFIEQNPDAFWHMSPEELEEKKERDEVQKFRDWVKISARQICIRVHYHVGAHNHRNRYLEILERLIRENNMQEIRVRTEHFQRYIHPLEMYHMGATPHMMCECQHDGCYKNNLANWLSRSGPITLPTYDDYPIVWRM